MGKFVITEEEKKRILNMHQSTKMNPFLFESEVKQGTVLNSGKKVINIGKPTKAGNPETTVVFIQTDEDGTGGNFVCARHEKGVYALHPGTAQTLTKDESQSLYNAHCAASKPTVA
jgi:hypothetical protein